MGRVTYKSAGVDIDKANALVKDYRHFAASTKIKGVLSDVGSFGALFRPDFRKFVSCKRAVEINRNVCHLLNLLFRWAGAICRCRICVKPLSS